MTEGLWRCAAVVMVAAGPALAQPKPTPTVLDWVRNAPTGPVEVFDRHLPGERWRLADGNITSSVWHAWRAGSLVIVMGGSDRVIGEVVTVIDAIGKQQKVEFLCNDAALSPDGMRIAFRKFYPHFGTAAISDELRVLDLGISLNRPQLSDFP